MDSDKRIAKYAKLGFVIYIGLFAVLLLTACSIAPEVYVHKELANPSSQLLRIVDCNNTLEFSGPWAWDSLSILQGSDKNGDEFVSCFYFGHYGNKEGDVEKNIQFSYRVIYPTKRIVSENEVLVNDFQATEKFKLKILSVGDKEFINCEKNSEQYSCIIAAQYQDAVVLLRFWGDREVDVTPTEKLINSTLTRLDKSIRKLK